MMKSKPDLAYLGPEGTFSEILSRKWCGQTHNLVPKSSIDEIFDYVNADPSCEGIVPIENSSGGIIHTTVDRLIAPENSLSIKEELSMNVSIALVGHSGNKALRVYSHQAPLHHCSKWLKENMPNVQKIEAASTAEAAKKTTEDKNAVALCTRAAAEIYSLDILQYPVKLDMVNITRFYRIGHGQTTARNKQKTSILATLPNSPGALVDFLLPFKEKSVNLTRILSRPIPGKPQEYVFLVDLMGADDSSKVHKSIDFIINNKLCTHLKIMGSYPVAETIES